MSYQIPFPVVNQLLDAFTTASTSTWARLPPAKRDTFSWRLGVAATSALSANSKSSNRSTYDWKYFKSEISLLYIAVHILNTLYS